MADGVLFRCRVRGTAREGDRIRLSLNWTFSRRADLVLTDSELTWGSWSIPYTEIEDAVLVRMGALWWRLIVRGRGKTYQFILPPASIWTWDAKVDTFWDGPLPFSLRRVDGVLEPRSRALIALAALVALAIALWKLLRVGG
jgi:hypothetical protein